MDAGLPAGTRLGAAQIAEVTAALAARLHPQAQFAETAEHDLGVAIAADAIRAAFLELWRRDAQPTDDEGCKEKPPPCRPTASGLNLSLGTLFSERR